MVMLKAGAKAEIVSPEVYAALRTWLICWGPASLVQLTELLSDVSKDTGYGHVRIEVAEGRMVLLKAEKSYKAAKP